MTEVVVPMDAEDVDAAVDAAVERLHERQERPVEVLADPDAGTYTVRLAPDREPGQ